MQYLHSQIQQDNSSVRPHDLLGSYKLTESVKMSSLWFIDEVNQLELDGQLSRNQANLLRP
ncbi:MAG: hypothetical protein ACJ72Q_14485 [Nitrososphaeraceae archaeon]